MKANVFFLILWHAMFMNAAWAQPAAPAPTPPVRNAGDVISLFSGAYTDIGGTNWNPNWGQTTLVTDFTVSGNVCKKYANLNYQGVQFSSAVNASSMSNLHIDVWTTNVSTFDVYLINTSPALFERKVTLNPTFTGWNSFDIPLSQYSGVALNNIAQMKFVGVPTGGTIYFDNLYFWKSSSVPTITGFSIPEHFVGDAPFTLTQPASNSTGAFTYSSGNTSVATISGNVVTILGAGTSIITATQAAAPPYTTGTATATLVVSYLPPTTAAPTPPVRNASDRISLYSGAYANISGIDWNPSWGQSTQVSDIVIAGDTTRKYNNLNYQGVQLGSPLNISAMQKMHVDIWTPNCTSLDLYLINTSPSLVEQKVTLTPTLSGWNSYDIALTSFPAVNLSSINQMKLVATPNGSSLVYMDNLYFWKASNAPTITGFSVPAKVLGDAPFTITQPTSNSLGAFTYTSANPAVATVSGNVITIIGVGTSVITATQAPWMSYSSGTATSTLVVSYPPPATGAPTPPVRNIADYKSIFSDSYLNLTGTDWNPNWGQSTIVTEVTLGGNPTKKYDNLNYQGIQLANPLDVSAMQNLHIDIWTPNCTAFDLYLINTTPATVEQKVTLSPTFSGWNSFDIPLTQYTSIALNNISQIKFVGAPSGTSLVYMDNLYFWKSSNAPTLSNFSIAPRFVTDAPFVITPPTSNSSGAFSYSSSDVTVATVSGNVITIVGAGSTVITATQAAAAPYSAGSIATTFVVSTAPPPTAAPVPPARNASDVVCLFSGAYSEVAGTNWSPFWGQSTVVSEILIGGNATKKYERLNYQGIELAGPVNVSGMQKMHIDIWTPNCTSLDLYLVNTVPSTVEEEVTLTPTLSGWNSFDIDLSQYDTVNLSTITQLKFVGVPFGTASLFYDNFYFWKPAGTVPVRLTQYQVIKSGTVGKISWETTAEWNSRYFEVERSTDQRNWVVLGRVEAKGTFSGISRYGLTDPLPAPGYNYYRLRQTDWNGETSQFEVKALYFEQNETVALSIYPNPVQDQLQVFFQQDLPGVSRYQIAGVSGAVLQDGQWNGVTSRQRISLDVTRLPAGTYTLMVQNSNQRLIRTFIKK